MDKNAKAEPAKTTRQGQSQDKSQTAGKTQTEDAPIGGAESEKQTESPEYYGVSGNAQVMADQDSPPEQTVYTPPEKGSK